MLSHKRRPYLIHFHNILVDTKLSVRLGISSRPFKYFKNDELTPTAPIHDFRLLVRNQFSIKIVIKVDSVILHEKLLETDFFGHLNYTIPTQMFKIEEIKNASVYIYAIDTVKGVDLYLGCSNIQHIPKNSSVIISDFDKTLVDTKYKTTVELYRSLTSPIGNFPTIDSTLDKIKPMMKTGSPFFIVSASPHFYEPAIRKWLKENNIADAGIFLKDYRHFFSLQNTELFSKDIKVHGVFKLSNLLNLTYMLYWPNKITLFGDTSETDPLIYCLYKFIMTESFDIKMMWEKIKLMDAFKLTPFQDSKLLNRLHLIQTLKKKNQEDPLIIEIFIRRINHHEMHPLPEWLNQQRLSINYY